MTHFGVLIALLRDRKIFLDDIRHNVKTERKIISLLVSSSAFLAIYGAIIGSSSSWLQAISSAIKLPALYLITLIICLPTLYFFDILFGSRLNFSQYAALLLTNISVISVLLFSFAPITLFFLISIHDYNFFLLLNVAIFALTGLVGIKLFYQAVRSVARTEEDVFYAELPPQAYSQKHRQKYSQNPQKHPQKYSQKNPQKYSQQYAVRELDREEAELNEYELDDDELEDYKLEDYTPDGRARNSSKELQTKPPIAASELPQTRIRLLKFWLVLYGLVGSQLGWTLRPFFGAPGEPFQLFRPIESNFYSQVLRSLFSLLGLY
ncbi:hypothetical protein [Leptolyngbya ohadii]|uniref:hypothetical protein n=1 Tax=Leptolyngbya ohadii TaxID=1962290 RepID=UPI001CEC47DB|nr:hypothetical protein [Leptolyngbya ohadii]